jgi:prophage antirepressor-like protein
MNNEIMRMFDGHNVKVKEEDETWYRANDIGRILFPESSDPEHAINKLVNLIKKDYAIDNVYKFFKFPEDRKFKENHVSGSKYVSYINEIMLYELLFRTNSYQALTFKVWILNVIIK